MSNGSAVIPFSQIPECRLSRTPRHRGPRPPPRTRGPLRPQARPGMGAARRVWGRLNHGRLLPDRRGGHGGRLLLNRCRVLLLLPLFSLFRSLGGHILRIGRGRAVPVGIIGAAAGILADAHPAGLFHRAGDSIVLFPLLFFPLAFVQALLLGAAARSSAFLRRSAFSSSFSRRSCSARRAAAFS